jgi:hypothetical protein
VHAEVALFDLVLLVPLTEEEGRRLEVLEERMDDGQWEVRELGHQWANDNNQPGLGQVDGVGAAAIDDVVRCLFAALADVTDAEMEEYRA